MTPTQINTFYSRTKTAFLPYLDTKSLINVQLHDSKVQDKDRVTGSCLLYTGTAS